MIPCTSCTPAIISITLAYRMRDVHTHLLRRSIELVKEVKEGDLRDDVLFKLILRENTQTYIIWHFCSG